MVLPIDYNALQLMKLVADELSNKLNQNKDALRMREVAFHHLLDNDEEVQVHVLITRDKDDFLEDFQTEILT